MSKTIDSKRSRRRVVSVCATALVAAGCVAANASSAFAQSGLAAAKQQLQLYVDAPTSIGNFTPLAKAPPKGKTIVYLGTSEV